LTALSEATEMRVNEKDDSDQTVKEVAAGNNAIESAVKVLKEFCDDAFVQTSRYVPPDSDRNGKTVEDCCH